MTLAVIGYQQPLSHSYLNSLAQSTDLVADLRNFIGTTVPSSDSGVTGSVVYALGALAVGDGGAGLYFWHNTSTAADDGFHTIQPTGLSAGRWLRERPGGDGLVTIAATGAVAIASWQRTLVWQPTVPAAATLTLPATPADGQPHTVKNWLSSSAYALTLTANTGQTIEGDAYLVLANFGDFASVRWWAGASLWIRA